MGNAIPENSLVPKQVSLPHSLKRKLKQAAVESGKSESEIVRDALAVESKNATYRA